MNSLYNILDLDASATQEEIKKAFRDKSKDNHPDKIGDNPKQAEINKAYAVLKNPATRKRYDDTGKESAIPFDVRFRAFLQDTFLKLIEQVEDVTHQDLIGSFKNYVKSYISGAEQGKALLEKKLNKFQTILERLKSKQDGTISFVITNNITEVKRLILLTEDDIKFFKDCFEILNDYDYTFDLQEESTFVTVSFS